MGLNELIEQICHTLHPFENFGSIIIFLLVIIGTIIEITPIKINPWGTLLKWAGENFNSGINKKFDKIEERMNQIDDKINQHIENTDKKSAKELRQYLVNFVTQGVNGKRHTKESFDTAIRACDDYEQFVKEHNIKNGFIKSTIHAIRTKYEEHLLKADFAKEEHYINDNDNQN